MKPSENALALARTFEGCRLAAYRDSAGTLTIGYGHTDGVQDGDTCTPEQAEFWLNSDMTAAGLWVSRYVTTELTQNQFDALSDWVFNLGAGNFEESSLLRYVNARQFDAASEEFPKWFHAGGVVLPGLVSRRAAEQQLFVTV